MKTNYVLIDYENVQVSDLSLLKDEHFRVWLFIGPTSTKLKTDLVLGMHELHERLVPIPMKASGKNALDFHIAYYLGRLVHEDPEGFFHIISKDKGYDPLILHLKSKHTFVVRSESVEAMPCFQVARKPIVVVPDSDEKKLLELVVADLRKRKASKPGRLKTLLGTIRAVCGKDLPDSKVESVFRSLVKMSYVKVEGTKVQFNGL